MIGLLLLACVAASWLLTGVVRRTAPLDHPSSRSSHRVPTPRGGGAAIVAVTLADLAGGACAGLLEPRLALAIGGGGLLVGGVGWWDDRHTVTPLVRLVCHALAAGWAVWWLGGFPRIALGPWVIELGQWGSLPAIVVLVWSINLFNFMDGIDGLAGTEAIGVAAGAALLLSQHGLAGAATAALVLAAATAGFLPWNWTPAHIFLGDVGSGFLGYVLSLLSLWSEQRGGPPLLVWVTLGMVFVLDATVTLLRRVRRGAPITQAHRSHAYQRLVQSGWTHARVSTSVALLNLLLLAAAAFLPPLTGFLGALLLTTGAYLAVERRRPL